LSREIKRKINSIKKKREEALRKRVEATLDRFGFTLLTDEEVKQNDRSFNLMWERMTLAEREDYMEYVWPSVTDKLMVAKDILIYPLYSSLIEDKILPVAVQYHKSQDDFDLMWRLKTLWMWCKDPIVYREWMEAFGNDKFDRMPDHLVTWWKGLKGEWDKLVEGSREARLQKLRNEITYFEGELADPANQSEPDYLRDCRKDMSDIQGFLNGIGELG
jgi:hypothetical protein